MSKVQRTYNKSVLWEQQLCCCQGADSCFLLPKSKVAIIHTYPDIPGLADTSQQPAAIILR